MGQVVHVDDPADTEYAPAGQIEHDVPPVEKLPAGHWVHALENASENEPVGQVVHVDDPADTEYAPAGQIEHDVPHVENYLLDTGCTRSKTHPKMSQWDRLYMSTSLAGNTFQQGRMYPCKMMHHSLSSMCLLDNFGSCRHLLPQD